MEVKRSVCKFFPKRMKACPLGLLKRCKKVLKPQSEEEVLNQKIYEFITKKYDLEQPLEFKNLVLSIDFSMARAKIL